MLYFARAPNKYPFKKCRLDCRQLRWTLFWATMLELPIVPWYGYHAKSRDRRESNRSSIATGYSAFVICFSAHYRPHPLLNQGLQACISLISQRDQCIAWSVRTFSRDFRLRRVMDHWFWALDTLKVLRHSESPEDKCWYNAQCLTAEMKQQ